VILLGLQLQVGNLVPSCQNTALREATRRGRKCNTMQMHVELDDTQCEMHCRELRAS
jgi:hypothetical protein